MMKNWIENMAQFCRHKNSLLRQQSEFASPADWIDMIFEVRKFLI
jgi:hypothetical protein